MRMENSMTVPKARLVAFAILFLPCIAILFYLVLETKNVSVAKAQFLIAQAVLVVEVRGEDGRPDPRVAVKEVLWCRDPAIRPQVGQKLRLTDLLACKKEQGYTGPGDYLV